MNTASKPRVALCGHNEPYELVRRALELEGSFAGLAGNAARGVAESTTRSNTALEAAVSTRQLSPWRSRARTGLPR